MQMKTVRQTFTMSPHATKYSIKSAFMNIYYDWNLFIYYKFLLKKKTLNLSFKSRIKKNHEMFLYLSVMQYFFKSLNLKIKKIITLKNMINKIKFKRRELFKFLKDCGKYANII